MNSHSSSSYIWATGSGTPNVAMGTTIMPSASLSTGGINVHYSEKTNEEIIKECVDTKIRMLPFVYDIETHEIDGRHDLDLQNRILYETVETTAFEHSYWSSLRKGVQINQLRYMENNTFATFCTLLGLFQTKESENRVIGALLNKKAEELLQKE